MIGEWDLVGGYGGTYRYRDADCYEVRHPGDDPNSFELVDRSTGSVRALTPSDLYGALDEAAMAIVRGAV